MTTLSGMAKSRATTSRVAHLRALLEERRRQLTIGVNDLMRDVRARDSVRLSDGQDGLEGEHRDDLDLALLQMRGETLAGIDAALRRLEAGTYGTCSDCQRDIASERLRALPFATRCRPCEEAREAAARPRRSPIVKTYIHHAIE
jgi:DnaK suppressor protein